ncbi:MAG: tetratricopeptide repeat protein [Bryobacterales bacterium]|nr:tetratricopeptide repeat protein [Bryobacteraceae bacterium]MDW8131916.1 tetratricopeptide repeat protein [Bryobacterales bacterium]
MRCRLALLAALLLVGACRRGPEHRFVRLAVPWFENLTGEPGYQWWGPALADLIAEAAAGSATVHVLPAQSPWEAAGLRATHLLHGFFAIEGDRLRLEAALEDVARRAVERRFVVESPPAAGPGPLADRLATQLGLRSRSVAGRDARSLETYIAAARAPDPAPLLERAIAADPCFLAPYLLLARVRLAKGDREGAVAVLGRALAAKLDPIARSRAELALAGIRGDAAAHRRALETLASLVPADPEIRQALAALSVGRRDYSGALRAYREALERDPANAALLNEAAYAAAYAGNFREAVSLLDRYRQLRPGDPNPADSLGDVHFMMGQFSRAASLYLDSVKIAPDSVTAVSLFKAAWARWLEGDREAADRHMGEFLAGRQAARDPLLELRRAQWHYLTGRSAEAVSRLRGVVDGQPPGELRALAAGFLAAWSLEAGDREQARRYAAAARAARTPQARQLARLCAALAEGPNPPGVWTGRLRDAFPDPAEGILRDTALAYALLLEGQFREALPVLQGLLERTPPLPEEILPVLSAWAADASGQDPGPWLVRWPAPPLAFPQPFEFLAWPRVVYLQARRTELAGAHERSLALYRQFLRLVGDRPGHAREREQARRAGGF